MREAITITTVEQRRAWVLMKVIAGEARVSEAAVTPGLSLVHGNRDRGSSRRIDERVRELARGRYYGANDSHLAELLAEAEGITLQSRQRPTDPGRFTGPAPSRRPTPSPPGGRFRTGSGSITSASRLLSEVPPGRRP